MRKILLSLIAILAIINFSMAQTVINVPAAHVVNFQQLADFEKTHPPVQHKKHLIEQGEDKDKDFHYVGKHITGVSSIFNVTLPEGNERTVSPAASLVFDGTMDGGNLIPPDINGVAGDTLLMEVDNQQFDIYEKNGNHVSTLSINTFFNATGGSGYFDPHLIYDKIHHRYVVIIDGNASNGNGGLFIGISQTQNPNGNWYVYGFDAVGNGADFLDYPLLGINNKWIVISANDFIGGNNPVYSKIYVMNRATLFAGGAFAVTTFTDQNVFTLAPAVTCDSTEANEYLVADWNGDSANIGYTRIYKISGNVGTPAYSAVGMIGLNQPWDENPVGAPQAGGAQTLEDGDTRISNAIFINGSLWYTHCVYLPAGNPTHDAADWYQIIPSTLTLQQFGRVVDPTANIFYIYPSIGVNSNNDVLLGYSVCSPTTFASSGYSFRAGTDPVNTMQSTYIYKNGLAYYYKTFGGGRNRWGDYTFTCEDPEDGSFWTFQEFADAPSSNWGTEIAHIIATPCSGTPTAGTIAVANDTLCSGQGTILTLNGYSSGVLGISENWEESANGSSGWGTVVGGSGNGTPVYNTPALTNTTFYRCTVTCSNSGLSATTAVVQVNIPGVSSVTGDTSCTPQVFTLAATGSGTLNWYDAPSGGNLVNTGSTFTTPFLSSTTTYYVESDISNPIQQVGPLDNTMGAGGNYNTQERFEIFDAIQAFKLISVKVYAQGTANRTFRLKDAAGNILHDTIINVAAGTQVVTVNVNVPAGTGLQFGCTGATINLYRNSAGASYPYTLAGICSITGNSVPDPARYYFVYDWHIKLPDCASARTPVSAVIGSGINPTITPAGPIDVCEGTNVTLTASAAGPWLWSNAMTTQSITVNQSGSYSYSVFDANCGVNITSPSVIVTTHAVPVSAFTYVANGATLTFTDASTNTIGWNWDFGNGSNSALQNPVHTYANNLLSYVVTLISSNGYCTDTSSQTVCVPHTALTVSGNHTFCNGNSVTLTTTNGSVWSWQPNGQTTPSITVTSSGTYYCLVSNVNCGPYNTDTSVVNVLNVPVASFTNTTSNPTIVFTNTSTNGTSFQWNFGDGGGSTIMNPTHTYTANGTFTVTLIVCNGQCCDTTTSQVDIAGLGVDAISFNSNLIIYPNPTTGLLVIKNHAVKSGDVVEVTDVLGRVVMKKIMGAENEIDISSFAKGVYFVELTTANGKIFGKVVKD